MSQTDNEYEVSLLYTDPKKLVLHYQNLISIIVKKYITKKIFSPSQYQDVVQTINIELLDKMDGIAQLYNGKALLSTYMAVIIQNICNKIHFDKQYMIDTVPLEEKIDKHNISIEDRVIIEQEIKRLKTILTMFDVGRGKIILMLKIFFRLPIKKREVVRCYPKISHNDLESIINAFGDDYEQMTNKEVFDITKELFLRYENKNISGYSIRRWMSRIVKKILLLLNGVPAEQAYSKETLKILFEKYLESEK